MSSPEEPLHYWFSQLPAGWDIKRLKWSVASEKNGTWGMDPRGDMFDIACIRVADFDRTTLSVTNAPTIRNVVPSDRHGRIVEYGDLLLEKSGGGEGQPVGAVVMYRGQESAVCSNFIARIPTVPDVDGRYFLYLHAALYSARINVRSIKQTSGIQNLDSGAYLSEIVPYPPRAMQSRIADFLDDETAEIDGLVGKYSDFLNRLQEKRLSLISHAVVTGLNPQAEFKDSAVEYIGRLPRHWEELPIRRLAARIQTGQTPSEDDLCELGETPWYTPGDFRTDLELATAQKYLDVNARQNVRIFPAGSVLTVGIGATLGKVGLAKLRCSGNQQINAITANGRVSPKFLAFALVAQESTLRMLAQSSTLPILNQSRLASVHIPVPPLDEQESIVRYLDQQILTMSATAGRVAACLSLLQERRGGIISAAVKGEIDLDSYSQRPTGHVAS